MKMFPCIYNSFQLSSLSFKGWSELINIHVAMVSVSEFLSHHYIQDRSRISRARVKCVGRLIMKTTIKCTNKPVSKNFK